MQLAFCVSLRFWKPLFLAACVLFGVPIFAQNNPNTDQGMKPYDSFHGGALDSVSVTSGNLFFHKTEYAVPQRGSVGLSFSLQYNNKGFQLQIVCVNGSRGPWESPLSTSTNPSNGGTGCAAYYTWHWVGSGVTLVQDQSLTVGGQNVDSGQQNGYGQEVYVATYSAQTADGSKHQIADTGNGYRSIDGSGIWWVGPSTPPAVFAVDRNGMLNGGTNDPNGNFLSMDSSNNYHDTVGRTIPMPQSPPATSTASLSSCPNLNLAYQPVTYAYYWDVPGPTGTSRYLLCYASIYIRTAFFVPGTYLNGTYTKDVSTSVNMLQSVVRPDGTAWSFTYDAANPSDTTSIAYGDLLKIGFPTGGSIAYTYATELAYQGQFMNGMQTQQSRSVITRTVDANDGTGPHTSTYAWGSNVVANTTSSYVIENTVTDPLGNDTVHQITGLFAGPSLYETQTRYYQGSQTSGTLLKTVNTDYSYSSNPFDQVGPTPAPPTAINVAPIRVTTILPNGLTSKEETDHDSGFTFRDPLWGAPVYPPMSETSMTYPGTLGTVSARREYDYGSGSAGNLLRQTFTTYFWQGDSDYLNANLLDLPASVVIKDGSNTRLAETDYSYDEPSYLTSSGVTTQHGAAPNSVRGNLTTVSKWLNTSANPVVTHTNWYDTGEVYKSFDALGNATTHSYHPAYAGAYSTMTCNVLTQCVSGTYDFNTGLLTSFTDANAAYQASGTAQGDPAHTSNYSYDNMLRMTQALFPPDTNGQRPETDFNYPNVTTVERLKKISSTLTDDLFGYFDGVGRPYKTVHASAGNATVLTTYDAAGRVASVANPFFSTSDPTYGITFYQYDALGRGTQTTKQDGSMSLAQYDLASGTTNCSLTTDEAGKQRKACTDGLGRLVEVDEPQASSVGSNATASVTISGSIATGQTQPAATAAVNTPIVMASANDLYYLGADQHVHELYDWSGAGSPGSWHNNDLVTITGGAAWSGSTLFAYYDGSHSVTNVLYESSDQHIRHFWCCRSNAWVADDTTSLAAFAVPGAANTSIQMASLNDLYYLGSNGHVQNLHNWSGGGSQSTWGVYDLNGNLGAPAFSGNTLFAYADSGHGVTNVLYESSDQHIRHFWCCQAGSWVADDTTALATWAVPGAVNTSVQMSSLNALFYLGSNGSVQHMYNWSGGGSQGTWGVYDLNGNLGVGAFSGSTLFSYADSSHSVTNVLYESSDQHMRHFWCCRSGTWVADDLTASASGGVSGIANTPVGMGQANDLFYLASDQSVRELYNWSGAASSGTWANNSLTYLTGAPAPSGSTLFAYYDSGQGITNVIYESSDQHLRHLWCCHSGRWVADDLSISSVNASDSGTVALTMDGFTATACYGNSSNSACTGKPINLTAGDVAAALANAINAANSPATASVSGSTINLTWKVPGPFTPSISVLSTTHDNPGQFTSPSFTSPATNFASGTGNLGTSPYVTLYGYDTLGNLLRVDQKGTAPSDSSQWRTRTFTYDSLSRLLTAYNPESGTISYSYDADGNVLQKTSPAPNQLPPSSATQTISYCYDKLSRITGRQYAATSCPLSSPAVTYTYDSGTNGIGRLTSLADQAGSGSYSYDGLGRIATEQRTIAGVQKSLSYVYFLDSSMQNLTYPSGATVTYTPDTAGRMVSAIDNSNNIQYVTGATYGPDSSLTGFVSGHSSTFAGITSSFSFNKRLQPVLMSATAPNQTVFSIGYDFHFGAGNNGNVFSLINYRDQSRTQTFTYDALNRLTSAQNAGTDCTRMTVNGRTEYWGNSYSYDAWGNLTNKTPTKCSAENLNEAAWGSNQLHTISGPDNTYDVAGNMIHDATTGLNYTYDAENRITGAGGYTYTYDADGNRVEKSNGSTGTIYWYMSPGIVAESDLTGTLKSEYVFFDGERVARKDFSGSATSISYYFSDHLKTASVITDSAGTITEDEDYYPWGGELQFVNNDSNHYKFGGKERDGETGLDYFGARYYGNWLGRFMSADWAAKPEAVPYSDLHDPQSLNLYSYVRNIPTSKADPDGHCFWDLCLVEVGGALITIGEAAGLITTGFALGAAMDHQGILGQRGQIDPNDTVSMAMSEGMVTLPTEGVNTQTPPSTTTTVDTTPPASTSQAGTVGASTIHATKNTGTIYVVPGSGTKSGLPYVGRHNKPDPAKTRRSNDGRDRTKAKVVRKYRASDEQAGRQAEQEEINKRGGVDKLDNQRNEIKQPN